MKTRIILQDNLWFRGPPNYGNYELNGRSMIAVTPQLGRTASDDVAAKEKELEWLKKYTGRKGKGLVIAQEWFRPSGLIDRNLRESWLGILRRNAPKAKWCIFYDPILAFIQRGAMQPGQRPDFDRSAIWKIWKQDLDYLRPYFDHRQYWRLDNGHPVLYVWAAFALDNVERAFARARSEGLYVLADVLGTNVRPPHANGITGFTAALPSLIRQEYQLTTLRGAYLQAMKLAEEARDAEGYDFIPAGSCQYDDTTFLRARRRGETPLRITAESLSEVEEFLIEAMRRSEPIEGTRYLFWGTMNNWAEGTTVLPTKKQGKRFVKGGIGHYRFDHLKAIERVVFQGKGLAQAPDDGPDRGGGTG